MYKNSGSAKEALFCSKLAILELCGWIEESMDDVILRCASRHLKVSANSDYVQQQIVRRTYGFDYKTHFRKMLIQLVGIINVEKLEKNVDSTKQLKLKAVLSALKTARDSEAHTHIKGVTKSINAPSVTLSQFPTIYDGLTAFDEAIRKTKF